MAKIQAPQFLAPKNTTMKNCCPELSLSYIKTLPGFFLVLFLFFFIQSCQQNQNKTKKASLSSFCPSQHITTSCHWQVAHTGLDPTPDPSISDTVGFPQSSPEPLKTQGMDSTRLPRKALGWQARTHKFQKFPGMLGVL